jgi:hypothetical protein
LTEIYLKNFILEVLAYVEKLQLMRRKTDVTFAANPEIYYQDFFSSLKQNNKKSKWVVIPFLIQM